MTQTSAMMQGLRDALDAEDIRSKNDDGNKRETIFTTTRYEITDILNDSGQSVIVVKVEWKIDDDGAAIPPTEFAMSAKNWGWVEVKFDAQEKVISKIRRQLANPLEF